MWHIHDITETSKFNPKLWVSSSIQSERTTKNCESFHSILNTYPYILLYFHVLNLKIQTDSYIIVSGPTSNKISKNKNYEIEKKNVLQKLFTTILIKKLIDSLM